MQLASRSQSSRIPAVAKLPLIGSALDLTPFVALQDLGMAGRSHGFAHCANGYPGPLQIEYPTAGDPAGPGPVLVIDAISHSEGLRALRALQIRELDTVLRKVAVPSVPPTP